MKIQTVYLVSDTAPALAEFYTQALALQPRFADGDRWVQLSDGATGLAIARPDEAPAGHMLPTVVFRAEDLEEARQRILAHGGTEAGLRDMGAHGRVATFRDPQGNLFQVHAPAAAT